MLARKAFCLVALCLWLSPAGAQLSDKAGTAGFQFLKIGVGARETALGDAAVALSRGPNALYWNVAGIAVDEQSSALFFHNNWIGDIRHNYAAVKIAITDQNFVGFGINLLGMEDMEETTIDQPQGTGRRFAAGDLALTGSYAIRLTDRFTAGVSAKYIREYIWDLAAEGWAFDIGMLYVLNRLHLGIAFRDFGTNKQIGGSQLETDQQLFEGWDTSPVAVALAPKAIRLPMSFHFGVAYDAIAVEDHRLSLMGSISYFGDVGQKESVGLEYTFMGRYALRGGYKFRRDLVSISGGVGARVDIGGAEVGADFAVLAMKAFGARPQFDLTISF